MTTPHPSGNTKASSAALSVNGIVIDAQAITQETPVHASETNPGLAARRALVVRELLTQQARAKGLLADGAALDDNTIDQLLDLECATPEPTDEECQRYFKANAMKFRSPDLAFASHILFALTEGVSLAQLRARAEQALNDLREHPEQFGEMARTLSNCPSGQVGGNLGQLTRGEAVPEFETALFNSPLKGLLPDLVKTRYGFHIVLVERRIKGKPLPYEAARAGIQRFLGEYVRQKAIQQYLTLLISSAEIKGITLEARPGLLLQ